jgi:hypothetical protein
MSKKTVKHKVKSLAQRNTAEYDARLQDECALAAQLMREEGITRSEALKRAACILEGRTYTARS